MTKRFSEECVIRIWRMATDHTLITSQHFGHSSLTLRGKGESPAKSTLEPWWCYISWWPGKKGAAKPRKSYTDDQWAEANFKEILFNKLDDPEKKEEKLLSAIWKAYELNPDVDKLRPGQKIGKSPSGTRIRLGQSADTKIYIPGLGRAKEIRGIQGTGIDKEVRPGKKTMTISEKRYWGLSLQNMVNYWDKNQKGKFKIIKDNCSGKVRKVLLAGGADAYLSPPSEKSFLNPNIINKWGEKLQQNIDNLDFMTYMFEKNQLPQYLGTNKPHWWQKSDMRASVSASIGDIEPLMNYTKFKQFYKKENWTIKKALNQYHGIKGWGPNAVNMKLKALIQIMSYVTDKINAYYGPKNEAFYHLLLLGKQVIHVLSGKNIKGEKIKNKDYFNYAKLFGQKKFQAARWSHRGNWK